MAWGAWNRHAWAWRLRASERPTNNDCVDVLRPALSHWKPVQDWVIMLQKAQSSRDENGRVLENTARGYRVQSGVNHPERRFGSGLHGGMTRAKILQPS